jgi:hypothetical protein
MSLVTLRPSQVDKKAVKIRDLDLEASLTSFRYARTLAESWRTAMMLAVTLSGSM